MHGFLERWSDDVDLFTDIADPVAFSEAVDAMAAAYRALSPSSIALDIRYGGSMSAHIHVLPHVVPRSTRLP